MISLIPLKNYICSIKIFLIFTIALLSNFAFAVSSYTYSMDGSEVTDIGTGLVSRRCSEGQTWNGSTCIGLAMIFTHQAALERAATQTGWRLPNIKELSSLANKSNINPAIDTVAFPVTVSSHYWSASPFAGFTATAWGVNFSNGTVGSYLRSGSLSVRLVR